MVTGFVPSAARAASTTYYVDCSGGNDSATGTSTGSAWKTIGRANQASLQPGDSLLLKRSCTWNEQLKVRWSGTASAAITIGAYGSGNLPMLQNQSAQVYITGSRVVVQDISTRADPLTHDAQCNNAPAGRRVGFRLVAGSSYDVIRRVVASNMFIGIEIDQGSHHNQILNSTARDNNVKSDQGSSDAGAVGITLMGDDNLVQGNTISGSDVCSRFYGRDGSAVEVYGGQRNTIRGNLAVDNNQFTELGNSRSADNTFAYNVVRSRLATGHFMTTRGTSDANYGPVMRTKVYNNTAYLSGAQAYGVQCTKGCSSSVLSFRNNIVVSFDRVGYADHAFDEGNNIFWRPGGNPVVYFAIASTSKKVDPKFVDAAGGDFRLQAGSPAIDAGANVAYDAGFTTDYAGNGVPRGAVDIGAFERGGSTTPPPPPPDASAADAFTRTVTDGWGKADTGGTYTLFGNTADYSANGTAGVMDVPVHSSRTATLPAVSLTDLDATLRFKASSAAVGSSVYAYLLGRLKASGDAYRAKVYIGTDGTLSVRASKDVGGNEQPLGSFQPTGLTFTSGQFYRVRVQMTGTNPTTIRMKVWKASGTEPGTWQLQVTDSASSLQSAGAVGVQAYVEQAGAQVSVTFDDLDVSAP